MELHWQELTNGCCTESWQPSGRALRRAAIMIIDDGVANNELTKASMKLARPTGMAISIITLEKALTNLRPGKYDDHNVFVIVKSPVTLKSLSEAGGDDTGAGGGGTTHPDESQHSVKLYQRAYATDRDRGVQGVKKTAGPNLRPVRSGGLGGKSG